jgi:transposase
VRHLSTIGFPHPAEQIAFEEYRQAIKETHERLRRLTEQLREQSNSWRMNRLVTALMCLRGFDFAAATTLVAEIGDPRRFAQPRELMSYLGLVPSEHSSGQSRHQGAITRTGNKHVRRLLVEASWNYRHGARISRGIKVRQQNEPKVVRDIAWRAQLRLAKRFRHLSLRRGTARNKVCIAIARELAGFVWDIARQVCPTI